MKKPWMINVLLLVFVLFTAVSISAEGTATSLRLMDEANLLTNQEEQKLLAELDEVSERHHIDVVVVTVNSLHGQSSRVVADDYFDSHGYGQGADKSGVLLLHCPEKRDWWISTSGAGIAAFTDKGIDYIGDQITPFLADGKNFKAYKEFAHQCNLFLKEAAKGEPFDRGHMPRQPLPLWVIFVCIGCGCVISGVIVSAMKRKHLSARLQSGANQYIRPGSMRVCQQSDIFLYRNVSRTEKSDNSSSFRSGGGRSGSSSHVSSSGARHGGGGGKY